MAVYSSTKVSETAHLRHPRGQNVAGRLLLCLQLRQPRRRFTLRTFGAVHLVGSCWCCWWAVSEEYENHWAYHHPSLVVLVYLF